MVLLLKATPQWVPLSIIPCCMLCYHQFSLFLRPHHCRICGALICDQCSPARVLLSTAATPQRVCELCSISLDLTVDLSNEMIEKFILQRQQQTSEKQEYLSSLYAETPAPDLSPKSSVIRPPSPGFSVSKLDLDNDEDDNSNNHDDEEVHLNSPVVIIEDATNADQPTTVNDDDDTKSVSSVVAGSVVVGSVDTGSVVGGSVAGGSVVGGSECGSTAAAPDSTTSANPVSANIMSAFEDMDEPEPQPTPVRPNNHVSPQLAALTLASASPRPTPKLSLSKSGKDTTSLPSPASLSPVAIAALHLSTDQCQTPSGRVAHRRMCFGSLQSSLSRPLQAGATTTLSGTLSASNRLKTLKKNQLTQLIFQASFTAAAQEVINEQKHSSMDDINIPTLLDEVHPLTHAHDVSSTAPTPTAASAAAAVVAPTDDASDNQQQPPHHTLASTANSDDLAIFDSIRPQMAAPSLSIPHEDDHDVPIAAVTPMMSGRHSSSTLSASSTAALSSVTSNPLQQAGRYTLVDLWNFIWSKTPNLIIDTRPIEEYNLGHAPFAINIPISEEDFSPDHSELLPSLQDLTTRIANTTDARTFRMRRSRAIVIAGQAPPSGICRSVTLEQDINSPISDPNEVLNEYETEPHIVPQLLASALLKESLCASVDIVSFGGEAFTQRYPFLRCDYLNTNGHATLSTAAPPDVTQPLPKHVHLPRFPAFPNEIIDGCVFLGSEADSRQESQLEKLNITHILNATRDLPNCHESLVRSVTNVETGEVTDQPAFTYLRVPLDDNDQQSILEQLNNAFEFIDNALGTCTVDGRAGKVFIHCQMGVSRSASILIGYVMRSYSCTLHDALLMVRSRRQQVLPNRFFMQELARYECIIHNYSFEQSTYAACMKELYPK